MKVRTRDHFAMDEQALVLAQFLVTKLQTYVIHISPPLNNPRFTRSTSRLLVGIAGIPASGKSTFALALTSHINALHAQSAILIGLDGWHLTRAQLDAFPDPQLAHDRRGIHWTFDAPGYLSFLRILRTPGTTVLTAPSFDHALKDPLPDAVAIHPYHRIVIIEGLYTFLGMEPWDEAARMLDERCWVTCDEVEARKRIVKRHVVTGIAASLEEAEKRADENDMLSEYLLRVALVC
jgi:pantothenate kinase